ncbi:hypothetical protein [uncultured Variovorax sp.]|uniref:hypothetical protein n=1 Tax=uncultured Variovorax sp. TaxID=114708 RepID=UPI00260B519C|nr:hypothetical protein [uncultured Variovorax sp.]
MKRPLLRDELDQLVQRHEQLTSSTRTLYGLAPTDEQASTPFDWFCAAAARAIEILALAVLLVVLVSLAAGAGGPTP